jgi:hypothetical protein
MMTNFVARRLNAMKIFRLQRGWLAGLGLALAALGWNVAQAQGAGAEWVVFQDGKVFPERSKVPLEENITFPGAIRVMTNGTFTVNGGKERKFQEGQILNSDGTLVSPDGTITPVADHVTLDRGKVVLIKDGERTPVSQVATLADGSQVYPDGIVLRKDGSKIRLLDGQILKLNGTELPATDSITLQNGKVIVQKDGAKLYVKPGTSLMMSDGTKVFGDGTIVSKDGQKSAVTEGQIIPIEGPISRRK